MINKMIKAMLIFLGLIAVLSLISQLDPEAGKKVKDFAPVQEEVESE